MGAAFAHSREQEKPWSDFRAVLDAVYVQWEVDFWSKFYLQPNMDPLVHTRDQETVATVNFTLQTCSIDTRECPVRWTNWWPPFYEIHKVWYTPTTCRKAKRSQICTMPNYWAYSTLNGSRDGAIWVEKVLFHHGNTPAYTYSLVMAKLIALAYKLLPHPLYSPYWPRATVRFPNLKSLLAGHKFEPNEDVTAAIDVYFIDHGKSYFSDGLKKLKKL